MATEYALSFKDGRALGTFEQLQALLRRIVPALEFHWTTSGQEKLRVAAERGIEFPPAVRQSLESLPALFEGVAQGEGWRVEFGLGAAEPVTELCVTPRGSHPDLDRWCRELEAAVGTTMRVYGEPPTD